MKFDKVMLAAAFPSGRPPHRGAWIEIEAQSGNNRGGRRRPPHRGAWIEIGKFWGILNKLGSPPAQGGVD